MFVISIEKQNKNNSKKKLVNISILTSRATCVKPISDKHAIYEMFVVLLLVRNGSPRRKTQ